MFRRSLSLALVNPFFVGFLAILYFTIPNCISGIALDTPHSAIRPNDGYPPRTPMAVHFLLGSVRMKYFHKKYLS